VSETRQRHHRVTIRLDEPEWIRLSRDAENSGLTLAGRFRSAYFNSPPPRQSRRPPVCRTELATVLAATGAIGNNINQLAKIAQIGSWPEAARLNEACNDIRWMRHHLMLALGVRPDLSNVQFFEAS